LWTDGCCEFVDGVVAGVGAVLIDFAAGIFETFGTWLPENVVEFFREMGAMTR